MNRVRGEGCVLIAINFSPANPPSPPQLDKLLSLARYCTYPCAALHRTD